MASSIDIKHLTPQSIHFGRPETRKGGKVSYKHIDITDPAGDPLIVALPELFTFGLKRFLNEDGSSSGASLSIALFDKDGATKEQEFCWGALSTAFKRIKEHLVANGDLIGQRGLTIGELRRAEPVWFAPGSDSPVLNAKVYIRKDGTIGTPFFNDHTGERLTGAEIEGKYFRAQTYIQLASVYVGATIRIICRVFEANVTVPEERVHVRLRKRPPVFESSDDE